MPTFDIVKNINFNNTFRNKSIVDNYDLSDIKFEERFKGNIDIENKDWKIGLIVGGSGTGKTTIAKEIFDYNEENNHIFGNESIIDEMPKDKSVNEIVKMFVSVGLGSTPSYLKLYSVLSNGEKMRVELAYHLLSDEDLIVFDEFTSVVDRTVAKTTSYATQKSIRKNDSNKKFIAISCHYDIIDWLEPDWVYDTGSGNFFIKKNIKDQKLNLKSLGLMENLVQKYGKCLKVITI